MSVITEVFGFKKAIEKISPDYFKNNPALIEIIATVFLLFMFKLIIFTFLKNWESSIVAIALWIIYLIVYIIAIRRNEVAIFINGISEQNISFSKYVFSNSSWIRRLFVKSVSSGHNNYDLNLAIARLYEDYKDFKSTLEKNNIEKIYVGGLCRIPFLCAYGTFFHNIPAEIVMIEKSHDTNRWTFLNSTAKSPQTTKIDSTNCKPNKENEIAILVSFTFPIDVSSVPEKLQDHYSHIYVKNSARNLFMDTKSINQAVNKIIQEIDRINSTIKPSIIHLFLSVQTAVALKIGARIQSGMHPIIQIHNFDAQTKSYPWSLKITPMETEIKNKITLINN